MRLSMIACSLLIASSACTADFENAVVSVAAGGTATFALMADGTVQSWGSNGAGQLGDGTFVSHVAPAPVPGLSGVVQIAAGNAHACALLSDGTVKCWGYN